MVNNVGKGPDLSLPRRMIQPIVSISRGTVRTQAFTCRNVTLPLIDFSLDTLSVAERFLFCVFVVVSNFLDLQVLLCRNQPTSTSSLLGAAMI